MPFFQALVSNRLMPVKSPGKSQCHWCIPGRLFHRVCRCVVRGIHVDPSVHEGSEMDCVEVWDSATLAVGFGWTATPTVVAKALPHRAREFAVVGVWWCRLCCPSTNQPS